MNEEEDIHELQRERKDLADLVLMGLRDDIIEAVIIDHGYVEFEFIGKENYLGETSFTRGANTTSIDAMMLGRKANGKNIVIFIEWKYTETRDICTMNLSIN